MDHSSKMYLWWDVIFFYLTLPEVSEHQHHPIQLTIGIDGPFEASVNGGDFEKYELLLTGPDVPHALKARNHHFAVLMTFPETDAGRGFLGNLLKDRDYVELAPEQIKPFEEEIKAIGHTKRSPEFVRDLTQKIINHILDGEYDLGFHQSLDPRMKKAYEYITQVQVKNIRLEDAAREVHLSPSRFRHIFKEDMGIDFRNLVMQFRFVEALKRANTDKNLTQIAHETGFTDLAHMTRVFKKVGGITPSSYINARNFLQVIYD